MAEKNIKNVVFYQFFLFSVKVLIASLGCLNTDAENRKR